MVKASEVPSHLGIEIIKNVARVYDVLTFPVYFLLNQPWNKTRKFQEVRARQENPSDPYSPWFRNGERPPLIIDDCQTIDQIMRKCIATWKDRNCMGYRKVLKEESEVQPDGKVFIKKTLAPDYTWLNYNQVDQRIDNIMRRLLLNGVKPGDKMIIFMETRMEWMLTAQALYRLGGCLATVYANLGDDGVTHVINEVEATHIVTSTNLLPKLHKIRDRIPKLQTVIYLEDHLEVKEKESYGFSKIGLNLIRFVDLEEQGKKADPTVKGIAPKPDDIALIMYTSGSTGVPKGVVAWHRNFVAACQSLYTVLSQLDPREGDTNIAYLPLAHNLEFTTEHLQFSMGVAIGYSSPFTMTDVSPQVKSGCTGDINILRPRALIAVPLILDRIRKGIMDKVESRGRFVQLLFQYIVDYKIYWNDRGFDTPLLDNTLCKKISASLGGNLIAVFSGGAPLSPATHRFARACLNVHVMQGYGSTETTAITSLMDRYDRTEGLTGAPLFGIKARLIDWEEGGYHPTDKPNPRGEIVVGGPPVTSGYFKQEELTKEVFRDEEGIRWFYTGDIGEFLPDGNLKIIDRKKDLLKLAFGEYISLGKVEAEMKSCSYVDNICVYGDSFQNYIIALIIPNPVAIRPLARKLGLDDTLPLPTLYNNEAIVNEVLATIQEHGRKAGLHKSEIPKRVKLCAEEWTPDSGLVTAALKIRRKPIRDFYLKDIQRMYELDDCLSNGDSKNNHVSNGKGEIRNGKGSNGIVGKH